MANDGIVGGTGMERRVAPRCSLSRHLVPVDLGFQSGALLLDLSASGMGVHAESKARIGTSTEVHFQLPDSLSRVDGVGTVTWADASGRVGIRFDGLAATSRPLLSAWLSREQPPSLASGPRRNAPGEDEIALLRRDLRAQNIEGDNALAFVLERARSATGATGGALALESAGALLCRASSGAAPAIGAPLDPRSGLSGECVRSGEVVLCEDTETDARVDRLVCRTLHLRSAVIVPVKLQARLLGVLEMFSSHPHAFDAGHALLLSDAAALIAGLTQPEPAASVTAPVPAVAAPVPAVAAPVPAVAAPVPAVAAPASSAEPAAASVTASATDDSAAVPVASVDWPLLEDLPEPPPEYAYFAAPGRRLKILAIALIVAMLAGSAWAGWHWGQLHAILHPSAETAAFNTLPSPTSNDAAVAASVPALPLPNVPAAALPDPPLPAPKLAAPRKKDVPVLVIFPGSPPPQVSTPEPPPDLAPPMHGAAEAAGLSAVLSVAPVPASLEVPAATSRGVTGGKLIRKIEPAYPTGARSLRLGGMVVLKASIDVRGRVGGVTVVSGAPMLAAAAVRAVRDWRYEPFLLNGVPVATEVVVRVNFRPKQ